jgi:RHS repeat-associated protein
VHTRRVPPWGTSYPSAASGRDGEGSCREWFIQVYNAENRISSITKLASGDCTTPGLYDLTWDFVYDGDGVRTTTMVTPYDEEGLPETPTLTAYYFGGAYEVTGGNIKKYYNFGGQSILRENDGSLKYLLTDHLGSVVAVTDDTGTLISEQRYLPFGGVRTDVGSITQTDFGYTGQRNLDSEIGLMDYRARFYSSSLGRFIQPDTIVPDPINPQALNRYAYTLGNPIKFKDPSGHGVDCGIGMGCVSDPQPIITPPDGGGGSGGGGLCQACHNVPKPTNYTNPDYSDWYSGTYGGCFMCHSAVANGQVMLTNSQLAIADRNIREWALLGYSPLILTTGALAIPATGPEVTYLAGITCLRSPVCAALTGAGGITLQNVKTPYGAAYQVTTKEAQAARNLAQNGAPLYKIGTLGPSNAAESQFWSLQNPLLTPGYANQLGIPAQNLSSGNTFLIVGRLNVGASFVTRYAPGFGSNMGGEIEVVVNQYGVQIISFIMP